MIGTLVVNMPTNAVYLLNIEDSSQLLYHYDGLLNSLSKEESQSVEAKKTQDLRLLALGSKLLQRYAISEQSVPYIPMKRVLITVNDLKKPTHRIISFNTSHENERIVVAISESGSIGIDITNSQLDQDDEFLMMILSSEELTRVQKARPVVLFPVYWAIKEAFLKRHGGGLVSVDRLNDLTVKLPGGFEKIYQNQLAEGKSFKWMPPLSYSVSLNGRDQTDVQIHMFTWDSGLIGVIAVTKCLSTYNTRLDSQSYPYFDVHTVDVGSLLASPKSPKPS